MDMRVTTKPGEPPAGTADEARQRPPRRKLILRLAIMALLLLVVLGGLYGYDLFRQKMIAQFFANNVPPPTPVSAVAVTSESMPEYLEGIGSVVAVHQVSVAPEVNGRITKILFDSGAEVKAGDPLLQLNDEPERADLANFQALANLAQVTLGRSHKLASQQFMAQQTVDQNQSEFQVAQANIARIQAMIAQKLIRAPFGGQLGVRQVDVGQYLSAGTAIVTLTDLDTLHVNFTIPEHARAALAVGQPVEFRVDAFQNRTFKATLTTIEPQIDPATRNIKIQATLDNPGHLLLPGMFAAARVQLPAQSNILTAPETAIDYTAYGESVFLLREDGTGKDGKPKYKAVQTFVKTGTRQDGKVAILDGVKAGDLVVNAGQIKLQNGVEVVVTGTGELLKPSTTPIN
jgi:membrane fusion protein, multidrug efflux system